MDPNPSNRLSRVAKAVRRVMSQGIGHLGQGASAAGHGLLSARRTVVLSAGLGLLAWGLMLHPPMARVEAGELGVRTNLLTGASTEFREGSLMLLPGLHQLRRLSLRDQLYHPAEAAKATGAAPFQSVEGLSLGVDLTVRWAIDPSKLASGASSLPVDIQQEVVQPAVQGVVYKTMARHTVREIFSTKRADIQAQIEAELRPKLAADGLLLRSVQIGKVDLPADYRRGMDQLLAEELSSEKMRYTLELKEKQVKQTELEAQAEKVRRETEAEAAAREQVIAAKAQEEAMKHVLPFKQKQIEQRQLEAEAEKVARIRGAEGAAQARRIESQGEADSRQKLADAEAYRLAKVGQASAEQMAREGALVTRHPLLIQKTMADKLSDKIQVIIAPPPTNGDFLGATLLGGMSKASRSTAAEVSSAAEEGAPQ